VISQFMEAPREETDAEAIVRMIGERTGGDFSAKAVCKFLDELIEEDRKECDRLGIERDAD
jgi:methionine salvage enolase-phosphatase E1